MGKYPKSRLQEKYSDWHWQMIEKRCFLANIDGFWIEARKGRGVIAAYDLKEPGALITTTEKVIMDWFFKMRLPFYVIWADLDLNDFVVWKYYPSLIEEKINEKGEKYWSVKEGAQILEMSNWEYIQWIEKL